MCQGFGCLIDKMLNLYFIEPDANGDISHSEIIDRLGWEDNENAYLRDFVRIECSLWTEETIHFDKDTNLPGWAEHAHDEIINKATNLMLRINKLIAPYMRECDEISGKWRAILDKTDMFSRPQTTREFWAELDVARDKFVQVLIPIKGYVRANAHS